jgi:hypothetical protein
METGHSSKQTQKCNERNFPSRWLPNRQNAGDKQAKRKTITMTAPAQRAVRPVIGGAWRREDTWTPN